MKFPPVSLVVAVLAVLLHGAKGLRFKLKKGSPGGRWQFDGDVDCELPAVIANEFYSEWCFSDSEFHNSCKQTFFSQQAKIMGIRAGMFGLASHPNVCH
jgi:hypothetical protein